ncbi:alpha/beta hydrolase [Lentzea sp. PSKA42]|uniref:Alpha/beta hydrolase n=1 Tax=Lentzea indica TaxID=2604800 RepID=A0ABX1FFG5_9PSEU|nr:alpha/beta hydrolase [Lentzea indica]NKE57382.1 alpha/beta hydrolase [Lentzea indica]
MFSTLTGTGAAAGQPHAPALSWSPCEEGQPGECATVQVPVDWNKPKGEKLGVVIGRLKAAEPERRIGMLFVAPGGPGGSGIDAYVLGQNRINSGELRKRFDIVTWDQRGVGRSNEVKCSAELLGQWPANYPSSEQEYQDLLAYNAKLGADCRKHTGPVFDHVDTKSAVRDLDAIRAALGEKKISFYGASYGSQVGQQYAELFPARLRAMTIDSNMDHSLTSPGRYIATATEDLEGSFNAFADWCARTANCPLHGQDVRALWDGLHAKAEAGTLIDPDSGRPVSAERLRGELFGAMYSPSSSWYRIATRLRSLAGGAPAPLATTTAGEDELMGNSYQAIWCQDWKWRVDGYRDLRAYRDQAAAVAPHTKLSPFWSDVTSCLGWPARVNNPQHRLSIRNTPTILIVKSAADVATPEAWNFAVARQIRNSVLLSYDGIGHGQYFRSTCAQGHIDKYLIDVVTPAPHTHCAAVYPTEPPAALDAALGAAPRPVHVVG